MRLPPLTTRSTASGLTTINHKIGGFGTKYALLIRAYVGTSKTRQWVAASAKPNLTSLRRLFGDEPGADEFEWEIFPNGSGDYAVELTNDPVMASA